MPCPCRVPFAERMSSRLRRLSGQQYREQHREMLAVARADIFSEDIAFHFKACAFARRNRARCPISSTSPLCSSFSSFLHSSECRDALTRIIQQLVAGELRDAGGLALRGGRRLISKRRVIGPGCLRAFPKIPYPARWMRSSRLKRFSGWRYRKMHVTARADNGFGFL